MPKVELPSLDENVEHYAPDGNELDVQQFMDRRITELKEFRKASILATGRSLETIWKDADAAYQPHELDFNTRKRLESDEETGLRSRLVQVGTDGNWQSNSSSPDLYVKVNTALSILIDQNPEAVFLPDNKKYEKNTKLAYGNWKHSWEVSGAKQQLKNFVFNMAKYGNGYMRTYPKLVEMQKSIRYEYYPDQPNKDKYNKKRLVKFNDLCRESLNPWQVWTSEMARPGDHLSMDDWYFEKDYSPDSFKQTFKDYVNIEAVSNNASTTENTIEGGETAKVERKITVGFYENQVLDLYVIWVPSSKVILYKSPLPNDDGMLSLVYGLWSFRDDRTTSGIGLYEIIKNDCNMYDRLSNMTMDQLTLSIYKMFFYKGTDVLGDNGQLLISPGKGEQVSDPQNITFLEVPGPGAESWKGLQFIQDRKDSTSGVTPQLAGKFAGNTLGQDIQAKDSALERMKAPLDFIVDALQQEAYLALSWQKQILSTPEVLEYTDPELLAASLKEFGLTDEEIQKYMTELQNPNPDSQLLFNEEADEEGNQRKFANIYREMPYNLENDDKGDLIESKNARFYRYGTDLPTGRLDWKGIIRIKPQSVLAPSKDLTKRMTLDMFNIVYPAIEKMLVQPQFISILLPPLKKIVTTFEQEIPDWLNEEALTALEESSKKPAPPPPPEPPKLSFSVKLETLPLSTQAQILEKYAGIDPMAPLEEASQSGESNEPSIFIDKGMGLAMSGSGETPQPPTPLEANGGPLQPLQKNGSLGAKTLGGAVGAVTKVE